MIVRPAACLLLLLSACVADPGVTVASSTPIAPATVPVPQEGRLLVLTREGSVVVMNPDGSDRAVLSDAAAVQPTWSPDGARIAWTQLAGDDALMVVTAADGSERVEIPVPFAPFYYAWSPAGGTIALLGAGRGDEVTLGLADPAGGVPRLVGGGTSYYFDWSPEGDALIAHIGASELSVVDTSTGDGRSVGVSAGVFRAPQWTGRGILHVPQPRTGSISARGLSVVAQTGTPRLELGGVLSNESEIIAEVDGSVAFTADGETDLIAYSIITDTEASLRVFDRSSQRARIVSDTVVLLAQWSPVGGHLLYLAGGDRGEFEWWIWTGDGSTRLASYRPSTTFLQSYLPFWDQYVRSLSLWSPSGDRVVYAHADGGVYVAAIDGSAPVRVADGVFAAWSSG